MPIGRPIAMLCAAASLLVLGCASPVSRGRSETDPLSLRSKFRGTVAQQRAQVVRTAEALIGSPYRFGGASPAGFDCSGLVLYSYANAGIDGLPTPQARSNDTRIPWL